MFYNEKLKNMDKALRRIGLSSLADKGLKVLNRAAEDAVKEAIPVFVSAVKEIKLERTGGFAASIPLQINQAAASSIAEMLSQRLLRLRGVIP